MLARIIFVKVRKKEREKERLNHVEEMSYRVVLVTFPYKE